MTVALLIIIVFIILCNIYVACTMSEDEMLKEFVIEQSKAGSICANLFYLPAWIIKAVKSFIKYQIRY